MGVRRRETSHDRPTIKSHDMALIREFQIWDCKATASSFETIQLAACAEPEGEDMLRVIEVDRILGNVVLVRNQDYPTIPSHVKMDSGEPMPGIRHDSAPDVVPLRHEKSARGAAVGRGGGRPETQTKKKACTSAVTVAKVYGSSLWHVHPEWKSRRTRFAAGIHSVVT
jgi:hypothetical protein